jgi:ketosteroid isomerase-like protein
VTDARAKVLEDFYAAFRARDWDAMRTLFAEDAQFGLTGRNPFAGDYRGPEAIVDVLRRLVEDTEGTLGPVRGDTWDVCTSDHHVILIEWLQATRQAREARFYIHLVCAVEDGKLKRAFANFVDQYDFDGLWA